MKALIKHLPILTIVLLTSTAASQKCYFPDGTESTGDVPCSTTSTSACCGHGHACLSNGLCMHTIYNGAVEPSGSWYGRGSCTDESWKSDDCPKYCIDEGDVLDNGMSVNKCDSEGNNEQYYWCESNKTKGMENKEACSNQEYYFTIKGADPTTVTIAGVTGVTLSSSATATAPPNSTTSSETTTPTSPPNAPQPSKNYSTAIGAGVGVPLGILALGILGYLFWRNRRKTRPYSQTTAPPYEPTDSHSEWVAMKNGPVSSPPGNRQETVFYKHQSTSEMGDQRSPVHQMPTNEHSEPQELGPGRLSW